MSTPPRMKAGDRRLQLLEASIACFAEHGYQGTTTARLAQAARISEPVLYRHFASKQELFVALLEQVGREVLREWRKAIAPLKSPQDQLRVLLSLNPATTDPRRPRPALSRHLFPPRRNSASQKSGCITRTLSALRAFLTNVIRRASAPGRFARTYRPADWRGSSYTRPSDLR